ncbi:alpha/beta hydrolase [Pelagibacteraceae bacterium]|nr:alpha/beta hydrolase [Pelagibacteraceae bacterium]
MKKFRYYNISKYRKLRYSTNNFSKNPFIVFLPGFKSDIEGKKPKSFQSFANKNKLGFLAIEYSGHGKSSGKFIKGNISLWTDDTKKLIQKIVKKNKFVIIGSSMGAWIALNQFRYFKNNIVGMLGIGSAPEFLERLMWNKFPKKIKNEILKKGLAVINHGEKTKYQYPISYQLIKDGRKNKVFSKKIFKNIQISMFHGKKDEVVPVFFSRKVLSIFKRAKKKLVIVKNGDHSLSDTKSLKMMRAELSSIVKNIS